MAKHGLKAVKHNKTGLNTKFKDNYGRELTRSQFIGSKSLQKEYGVHAVKSKNKKTYIRSNPNKNSKDNLE